MKSVPLGITLGVLLALSAMSRASAAVVSDVRAAQRPGSKLVDIIYNLNAAGQATVAVRVSTNNGATFDLPVASFSGDGYGSGVVPGVDKRIVWDAGIDWDGRHSDRVWVEVVADDEIMALVPSGTFVMGDAFAEGHAGELPLHAVFVSAFHMDRHEVSRSLWDAVRAWAVINGYSFENAGAGKGNLHPVHSVSWYDAVKWCNARSQMEGLTPVYYINPAQSVVYRSGTVDLCNDCVDWSADGYRLPTEAEWEKAARGGESDGRFAWSDTDNISHERANFNNNGGEPYAAGTGGYHPVYAVGAMPYTSPQGAFWSNGYGIFDMSGNVWEWCWDRYEDGWYANPDATLPDTRGPALGASRVIRGGGWNGFAFYARAAYRFFNPPESAANYLGFRCVRGRTDTAAAVGPIEVDTRNALSVDPQAGRHAADDTALHSFQVQANTDWTARSDSAWIVVTSGDSGSGNGTVVYALEHNSGAERAGNITVAGAMTTAVFSVVQTAGAPPPPVPAVRANNHAGALVVADDEPVSITVFLNAAGYAGTPADWWVLALPDYGADWYYLDDDMQWRPFEAGDLALCAPAYQGDLFDIAAPVTVLPPTLLPAGNYTVYFALDEQDGVLNWPAGPIVYDRVIVGVTRRE